MKVTVGILLLVAGACATASASSLHPIVDGSRVFGASQSGKWIDSGVTAHRLKGGERYTFYGFNSRLGVWSGSKPTKPDDQCPDVPLVTFSGVPDKAVIGLDAPWNALPRKPRVESANQPLYKKTVADYLSLHGVRRPNVEVTQVIRCDIDGNGSDSAIVAATYDAADHSGTRFYVVLIRHLVDGKVQTAPLLGDVALKADPARYPVQCKVEGLYDLQGNGKMETVIDAHYQDSEMVYIVAVKGNHVKTVLDTGCGV